MSKKEPENQTDNEQVQQQPEYPLQGTPLNPIMGEWTSST